MTGRSQPIVYLWWLVSRASGVVALVLITLSVMLGLAMAAKILRSPTVRRGAMKLHEQVALTALLAIAAHGVSLLGDHWLNPGWAGITVPFALSYRPQFTGAGIVGGYTALVLGPSFYLRRRLGARRWRRIHSLIFVSWLLAAVHALGAGSDAHRLWLRAIVFAPGIPIAYLLVLRGLSCNGGGSSSRARMVPGNQKFPAAKFSVCPRRRRRAGAVLSRYDGPPAPGLSARTETSGRVFDQGDPRRRPRDGPAQPATGTR